MIWSSWKIRIETWFSNSDSSHSPWMWEQLLGYLLLLCWFGNWGSLPSPPSWTFLEAGFTWKCVNLPQLRGLASAWDKVNYRGKTLSIGSPYNCLNSTYKFTSVLSWAFSILSRVCAFTWEDQVGLVHADGRPMLSKTEGGKPIPRCPLLCFISPPMSFLILFHLLKIYQGKEIITMNCIKVYFKPSL